MTERYRTVLYFIGIIGFLSALGMSLPAPVLPAFAKQFGASPVLIGTLFSAYSASWVFLQVFTGHLSDRWGRKRFIVLGLLVYGVFGLLVGKSRSMVDLLLLRTLQGTGVSLFGSPAIALVGELPGESGKNFGFFRSCQGVGLAAGPFIGGFLSDSYGLRFPFYVNGLMGLIAALMGVIFLIETRGKTEKGMPFREVLKILSQHRKLHFLIGAIFLSELTFVALDLLFPLRGEQLGMSFKQIGILFACYMVLFSITQTPIGILSGKIGDRRFILCLMTGVTAIIFYIATRVGSFQGILLVSCGLGIFLGGSFTQSTAFASDLVPPERKGISLALFDSAIDSSFFIAPVLVGFVIEYTSLEGAFLTCALLNIVAFIIIVGFLRTNRLNNSNLYA
ncbi:MAG: MFS transporter [Candidatus Heimdallarchaeota archaeon]